MQSRKCFPFFILVSQDEKYSSDYINLKVYLLQQFTGFYIMHDLDEKS